MHLLLRVTTSHLLLGITASHLLLGIATHLLLRVAHLLALIARRWAGTTSGAVSGPLLLRHGLANGHGVSVLDALGHLLVIVSLEEAADVGVGITLHDLLLAAAVAHDNGQAACKDH